ncbi:MAG: NAD(P)-dependent dehydrogenase (short-subunit alcohol dehydrogenase family) [Planctomycetota bacterium]|jgi:NAD(P)-dependent dehydrogenase (short-subunit alcohol dehydrogenase family)
MSKTIVITGCSTGFGRESALRFARRGDRVYATMRAVEGKNAERAAALRAEAKDEKLTLTVLELDVCDTASVEGAAKVVEGESGAPDVVINNAGVMYVGVTEAFDPSELTAQLDVNVVGVHRVCRAFLPAMRAANRGLIINVSSVAGRLAIPTFGIYQASKWALEGYSASLRYELASSGVDVVLVEPGPFRTELFGQSPAPKDSEGRAATYPAEFTSAMEAMGSMFETVLSDPEAPTDPALVVDLFVELTDMNAGSRPLRKTVGLDFGVEDYNQPTIEFDASVLAAMNLTSATRIRG